MKIIMTIRNLSSDDGNQIHSVSHRDEGDGEPKSHSDGSTKKNGIGDDDINQGLAEVTKTKMTVD